MNYQQQQYNPGYLPPLLPRTSTTAIISLISGIASWIILPFLGALVAIITGHIAKGEIKNGRGMITGNGMATAGLILGYLNIGLGVCVFCVAVILPLLGLGISIPFLHYSGSSY